MVQQAKMARQRTSRGGTANGTSGLSLGPRSLAVAARAVCPVCLCRDRMEKVSNIVRNGRGRLVWEDGEVSHYETELSELLDEPAPPRQMPFYRLFLNVLPPLLILVALLGVIDIVRIQSFVHVPESSTDIARDVGLAWFGVFIPAMLLFQFVQIRIQYRREMPRWAHARRRWSGLYYCSRDDVVFAPNLNMVASPPEMYSLLYPPESVANERVQQLARGGLWEATTTE